MDNLVNEFPSEDNPFVNVGKEVRSKGAVAKLGQ